MQRWFKIFLANFFIIVVFLGGLGALGYYLYDRDKYIATDDARVSANTINITALTPGKIVAWIVKPGDKVQANGVIGTQQTLTAGTSALQPSKPALSTNLVQKGLTTLQEPLDIAAETPGTNVGQAVGAKIDVKAPIDGTIIQNIVDTGQIVVAGQPLAMIADLNKVFIIANIEETKIRDVKPGQSVDIILDAFPGDTFSGTVQWFTRATASTFSMIPAGTTSGSYTKVTQRIPVQISIDTAGRVVLPGMSASIRIQK